MVGGLQGTLGNRRAFHSEKESWIWLKAPDQQGFSQLVRQFFFKEVDSPVQTSFEVMVSDEKEDYYEG